MHCGRCQGLMVIVAPVSRRVLELGKKGGDACCAVKPPIPASSPTESTFSRSLAVGRVYLNRRLLG